MNSNISESYSDKFTSIIIVLVIAINIKRETACMSYNDKWRDVLGVTNDTPQIALM
jgi:hypothetical protein